MTAVEPEEGQTLDLMQRRSLQKFKQEISVQLAPWQAGVNLNFPCTTTKQEPVHTNKAQTSSMCRHQRKITNKQNPNQLL